MREVDFHDMLVALYRTKIRVNKYYARLVFQLLDMCIVNTCFMYCREYSYLDIVNTWLCLNLEMK